MSLFGCVECAAAERRHDLKVTYAHGVEAAIPWEFKLFKDGFDFLDWLKQENLKSGPVTIIAWEYVPCR